MRVSKELHRQWSLPRGLRKCSRLKHRRSKWTQHDIKSSPKSVRPFLDRWGLHHHGRHWRQDCTHAGDAHIDAEKHSRHRGLGTMYEIDLASSSLVRCWPLHSSKIVGGTPCKYFHANRVTRGWVTMFVLGACYAWNPPQACFVAQSPSFDRILW